MLAKYRESSSELRDVARSVLGGSTGREGEATLGRAASPVVWQLLPGRAPGSRKLAHPPRPAADVPEAGGARGGEGPHVSHWGPRPGGGRRPCGSVTSSRSPSRAAAATFHPSVDPFS